MYSDNWKNKWNKAFHVLVAIVLVFMCFANALCLNVFAYKRGPGLSVDIVGEQLPKDTAYIDILIPVQKLPSSREPVEKTIVSWCSHKPISITASSEISEIQTIGGTEYCSFLMYYPGASMEEDTYYNFYVETFSVLIGQEETDIYRILNTFGSVVFAWVNENGEIQSYSNAVKIHDSPFNEIQCFRITGEEVRSDRLTNYYVVVPLLFLIVCVILGIIIIARLIQKKRIQNRIKKNEVS